MPLTPARQVAYGILRRVETGRAFAVDLLQGPEVMRLKELDRKLAMEVVMGVLRWRGELDFQIEQLSGKPLKYFDAEIATILRMGIYQIQFLEKVPKSAAVNEAVEVTKAAKKRSAAGLVNAVLRKCQPAKPRLAAKSLKTTDPQHLEAVRRSFPAWLLERWESTFGKDSANSLALASISVPRPTLRVAAGERERIQRELASEGFPAELGRYADSALHASSGNICASRPVSEGRAVIQDEASQLVAQLLSPRTGECVLDLCAAPGIKTSQLGAMLGAGSLVACDLSTRRLRTLAILTAGKIPPDVRMVLLRLDAARDLPFAVKFDRVLVDAPCSGTGTLARNPEIKWRLRENDLARLAELQQKILRNALKTLALGGRLVYSTCSLEPEENEQVVECALAGAGGFRLRAANELASEFPHLSSLFDSHGYFRTRPDMHAMDGFFAAVITREQDSSAALAA